MQASVNKSDVIWSYLGTAFSMLSNLITIPMVIYFLDSDLVGLWYIFVSIGAIANLFDFGFTVTLARNITYVWGGARRPYILPLTRVSGWAWSRRWSQDATLLVRIFPMYTPFVFLWLPSNCVNPNLLLKRFFNIKISLARQSSLYTIWWMTL